MTWIRVDDHFADHPKAMALGSDRLAGLGLWHVAASYCARFLTDGFVPYSAVRTAAPARLIRRMVEVGLFNEASGGYRLHDWLDYNPSRESVAAKAAQKQAAGRAGGQASAQARGQGNGRPESKPVPVPLPQPVPEILSDVLSNGAPEWVEPPELYQQLTRRPPSQKVRDWLEDLHARFSRTELVAAMRAVPGPRESDWLKKVDAYLERAA